MIVISERAQSNHNQTTTRISGKKKGAFFLFRIVKMFARPNEKKNCCHDFDIKKLCCKHPSVYYLVLSKFESEWNYSAEQKSYTKTV
jgi:hypothetical protein